ncbi:voltage-dependent T-type calcium channel subunit alpha-1G [Culicoides brevitarsis]|uniref:voltage-dependent T-type calcium channel subunit alpha-1G n=1 Tax=Culicoides brevitarsis TaxID=469753 RepID=UPI00307C9B70
MYQPCVDDECKHNKCKILEVFDDIIFAFFTLEMTIKIIAMGFCGAGTYIADSWNRLDFFIVMSGALEYCLQIENLNLTAIRTIRVLRPLRAINRIPSMRILVMLLLDTLPMLGNVLLLCFFVFFIFGIVGVQLWEGILRQRCVLKLPPHVSMPDIPLFYEISKEIDYICTKPEDSGMHMCNNLPPLQIGKTICNDTPAPFSLNLPKKDSCVNWNNYYTNCTQLGGNPFRGTISFDNIGLAWVAIFLVISLEGWTDIMYYVQDAHSFWDWIYFVLLIVIGSFFMINLCLVVIATQFSETKKREMERMRQERARFTSSSTIASSANNSEPTSCYGEIIKLIGHLYRKFKRRAISRSNFIRNCINWCNEATDEKDKDKQNNCPLHKNSNPEGKLRIKLPPSYAHVISKFSVEGRTIDLSNGMNHNKIEPKKEKSRTLILLKLPNQIEAANLAQHLKALDASKMPQKRRSSVLFNEYVILNAPVENNESTKKSDSLRDDQTLDKISSSNGPQWKIYDLDSTEKRFNILDWQNSNANILSCQELLAFSVAFSAALLTNRSMLECFHTVVVKKYKTDEKVSLKNSIQNRFTLFKWSPKFPKRSILCSFSCIFNCLTIFRRCVNKIVDHKYFQQGILLAILINTLSMGIEYHNQPEELTSIVETSNIIFSCIFAVEMLLKLIGEGPFKYISNGFNLFDGIIVILSVIEICQAGLGGREANSGLSVLRTFRLLRILKLVRFMPNLRRQLFVMLRTMDNVAVFFSLLVLFIFIFSILGMYLFGGKFCKYVDGSEERDCNCLEIVQNDPLCECDRKHFNNILWSTVTVFQILTQEDWNVVLFNGMEKTSHWAALYFVALMTFGNYVLFNLLVAILVEGFSSERNERREREQREFIKARLKEERLQEELNQMFENKSVLCGNEENLVTTQNVMNTSSAPVIITTSATPVDSPVLSSQEEDNNYNLNFLQLPTFNSIKSENGLHFKENYGNQYKTNIFPTDNKTKLIEKNNSNDKNDHHRSTMNTNILIKNLEEKKLHVSPLLIKQTANENIQRDLSSLSTLDKYESPKISSIDLCKQRPMLNLKNLQDVLESNSETNIEKSKTFLDNLPQIRTLLENRQDFSLYLFHENNKFRKTCTWIINQKWFDNVVLLFIALNCITLAMERPNIPPTSTERAFLQTANNVFTTVFSIEMFIKVVSTGMFYGKGAYFTSGWNIMDGSLVSISIIDLLMSLISDSSPRIFNILRVFRLLRSLRPLRVINRAPGLKLVVQTLLSSLRPIGNIVLICCTFFIIFGILGVQLFKGTFYHCEGTNIKDVVNKTQCLEREGNAWINRKYNFDDLGKALMSLFVLSSRDGWVNIMYTGLDSVGIDMQPIVNYNEWRLLYFISFILLVGFFVLNMFVGVVVENFHRCREEQEKEEKMRRLAKRALQIQKHKKRRSQPPYFASYNATRLFIHSVVTSKYFDLAIAAVIGLNVVGMALEYYMMPIALEYTLKIFNYFFTAVFIVEAVMKLCALGPVIYLKDKWNQLDVFIVLLSIIGIVLEELETNIIPINPTIIRVMRVLRIARVLKLLKMAKGIRALLDTVCQALPQVGNLGLLFFLLFFIFAALGVELFGRLECTDEVPCQGLGEHAHFANFGIAFLTLFRIATGDNWNGIMKDTLRDDCDDTADCVKNCCVNHVVAPIFFVIFVLMAQFVLVNVVVAVLMKHLEESHRQLEDDELDELERILEAELAYNGINPCMGFNSILKTPNENVSPIKKVNSLPDCTIANTSTTKDSNLLSQKLNINTNSKKNQTNVELSSLNNNTTSISKSNHMKSKIKSNKMNDDESSLLLPQKKICGVNSP